MRMPLTIIAAALVFAAFSPAHPAAAQQSSTPMPHGHSIITTGPFPALPGQDAFGAIQEIVRILEADPATDWSKVDLERLRQHLIDMNDVTLRTGVRAQPIAGGLVMDVAGAGRIAAAIRRMVVAHTAELNGMPQWTATTEEIPNSIRLTVVAKTPDDAKTVARIRGLGFIGLLVQGAHHQPHRLAMAKGEIIPAHGR
ncbi:MAG TPA: hypothetical protein VMD08_06230 [Candidatus Baltobacteraceae bacterium]|nr:hypothetical protein [Candidatus Baltobacteraceae bacterium]